MTVHAGGMGAHASDLANSAVSPLEQFQREVRGDDPFKNEKMMQEGNNFVVKLEKGSNIVIADDQTMVTVPYDCNVVVTFVVRPKRGMEAPAGFAPENVKVPAEIQQTEAFKLYLTRTAAVSVFMESQGRRHRDGFDSFRSLSRSIPELVDLHASEGTTPGSIERTSAVVAELLRMQTNSYDLEGKDSTEMVVLGNVVE